MSEIIHSTTVPFSGLPTAVLKISGQLEMQQGNQMILKNNKNGSSLHLVWLGPSFSAGRYITESLLEQAGLKGLSCSEVQRNQFAGSAHYGGTGTTLKAR